MGYLFIFVSTYSKIYISSTVLPTGFQTSKFNCQLDMYTSVSIKYIQLNMSKLEPLSPFSKLVQLRLSYYWS